MNATPIAEAAFRHFRSDPTLAQRLGLPESETAQEADPDEWGVSPPWTLTRVAVDFDGCMYEYEWHRAGKAAVEVETIIHRPWLPLGEPPIEPFSRVTLQRLRVNVAREWDAIAAAFCATLAEGSVTAIARRSSPTAPVFSPVPKEAWPHLEIEDWARGVASCEGEKLYALHVIENDTLAKITDPSEPDDTDIVRPPDVTGAEPTESRSRVLRKLAENYIKQLYPGGVPQELSSGKLHREVEDAMKANGLRHFPSLSTVKRAANRRVK
jgi:hypothetical protein